MKQPNYRKHAGLTFLAALSLTLALPLAGAGRAQAQSVMQDVSRLLGAQAVQGITASTAVPLAAGMQIEVGFSPEGSAAPLVLKAIASAHRSIHVMAYVMSNPEIVAALARAARAGVEVIVQADYRENITEDRRGTIRNRLAELTHAGVAVCTVDAFPIFHDKVIVIDSRHVQTGSFNYSSQAAHSNSENALVLWNAPAIAQQYEAHFRARVPLCAPYRPE